MYSESKQDNSFPHCYKWVYWRKRKPHIHRLSQKLNRGMNLPEQKERERELIKNKAEVDTVFHI